MFDNGRSLSSNTNENHLQKAIEEAHLRFSHQLSSPAPFNWLNLYLEKIRSQIFSMDNLLQMIEGHGVGLCIDAILDNIFKF